ncbi:SnoaL-like domain-containing protein [Amycolatopsis pretoriensis]|uniref:SnoaL-like domain-containing protein n=1 Tax=Amycolatopsis pretoriensis TaxID=218821 RepID=A0A1H5QQT5_9PSEU|nr:nuclear transport factor 2 family protein [Amycolatopsis pretoriensis]SEF27681.1 SnoaL-like domain-containing protein [Amycolatopsis pretoriensis]
MTIYPKTSTEHPNVDILKAVYADLTRLGEFAADDIVMHTAEREVSLENAKARGRAEVVAKERELIELTGGTLVMDVEDVVANDFFGAVTGFLRAHRGDDVLAVPFCGVWRFVDGKIVEHWENAYDLPAFSKFVSGRA